MYFAGDYSVLQENTGLINVNTCPNISHDFGRQGNH